MEVYIMTKIGRPKGGKNKSWSPEEKERIVKRYFEGEISRRQLGKEEKVSDSMLHQWIKKYEDEGIEGLVNKTGKRGNAFAALHRSKDLPEIKRLQLQVAQLQIEIERLKKGYIAKGVGANKEFVATRDLNSK